MSTTQAHKDQAKNTKDDLNDALGDLNRTTNRLRRKFDATDKWMETKVQQDESLLSRVQEASDVLATFSREGSTLTYLTGFGHGATYRPEASFLARNVTAEGRVHKVHIGPLMIFFRYGLIGLAAYAWLLFVIIRVLLGGRAATRRRDSPVTAFALASGGYLLEGLMFNVWVDPMFSFALAGLMASVLDERVVRQAVHDPRPAGVISRQGLKA